MKNELRVVLKEVGKIGEVKTIPNTLEALQEVVKGHIQTFSLTDEILIVLNEEGKIQGLQPNFIVPCHGGYEELIVGNVLFVSIDGCDFGSLKDEHIEFLKKVGIVKN